MNPVVLTYTYEPKAMPRAARNGLRTHMPDDYMAYRSALSFAMLAARRLAVNPPPKDQPMSVRVVFAMSTRRRVDLDNLLKTVLDAGNNVLWDDDHLVHHVEMDKVYRAGNPSTELEVRLA